jgi:hypothetical protein
MTIYWNFIPIWCCNYTLASDTWCVLNVHRDHIWHSHHWRKFEAGIWLIGLYRFNQFLMSCSKLQNKTFQHFFCWLFCTQCWALNVIEMKYILKMKAEIKLWTVVIFLAHSSHLLCACTCICGAALSHSILFYLKSSCTLCSRKWTAFNQVYVSQAEPTYRSVMCWNEHLAETGSVLQQNGPPCCMVSQDNAERIHETFQRRPCKSVVLHIMFLAQETKIAWLQASVGPKSACFRNAFSHRRGQDLPQILHTSTEYLFLK